MRLSHGNITSIICPLVFDPSSSLVPAWAGGGGVSSIGEDLLQSFHMSLRMIDWIGFVKGTVERMTVFCPNIINRIGQHWTFLLPAVWMATTPTMTSSSKKRRKFLRNGERVVSADSRKRRRRQVWPRPRNPISGRSAPSLRRSCATRWCRRRASPRCRPSWRRRRRLRFRSGQSSSAASLLTTSSTTCRRFSTESSTKRNVRPSTEKFRNRVRSKKAPKKLFNSRRNLFRASLVDTALSKLIGPNLAKF